MAAIENEKIYGLKIRESANDGSDFSNPDTDYRILFLGEDGFLHTRDSAGTVADAADSGGGGGGIAFSGVRVFRSGSDTGSISDGAAIPFNAEDFDTDTYHDNSSNPSRLTVPATGKYIVTASVGLASGASTSVKCAFNLSGTLVMSGSWFGDGSHNTYWSGTTGVVAATSGQYFELINKSTAARTFDFDSTSAYVWMTILRVA